MRFQHLTADNSDEKLESIGMFNWVKLPQEEVRFHNWGLHTTIQKCNLLRSRTKSCTVPKIDTTLRCKEFPTDIAGQEIWEQVKFQSISPNHVAVISQSQTSVLISRPDQEARGFEEAEKNGVMDRINGPLSFVSRWTLQTQYWYRRDRLWCHIYLEAGCRCVLRIVYITWKGPLQQPTCTSWRGRGQKDEVG